MTLELSLIIGFIFHLIGDYLLQNDWMARNKTKDSVAAMLHAAVYSLLFRLLVPKWYWMAIFISHFFIDRYRLAEYWIKLVNWNWRSKNHGYPEDKPKYMSVWLLIIIDNVFHIIVNSACIYFSIRG